MSHWFIAGAVAAAMRAFLEWRGLSQDASAICSVLWGGFVLVGLAVDRICDHLKERLT